MRHRFAKYGTALVAGAAFTVCSVAAAQTLNSLGLKATFFVTSGVVNTPNYFTLAQVQALAAAGHEIGGHTVYGYDPFGNRIQIGEAFEH